jgi:hypothetical protein
MGDDPWRQQGDYIREQKQKTQLFWVKIASLVVATVVAVVVVASFSCRSQTSSTDLVYPRIWFIEVELTGEKEE